MAAIIGIISRRGLRIEACHNHNHNQYWTDSMHRGPSTPQKELNRIHTQTIINRLGYIVC